MAVILNAILPVFFLIGIGLLVKIIQNHENPVMAKLCSLTGHCDDSWSEVLNKFALYVALPALILGSLIHADGSTVLSTQIILTNISLIILLIFLVLISVKAFRVKTALANTYIMCAFFGNVAYIGPPFVTSLLPGTEGNVSLLIAIHVVIAFTIGLAILEHSKYSQIDLLTIAKNILKNPLILATLLGLVFLYADFQVPSVIDKAINMLGASASPAVLIAIGLFLARKIKFDKNLLHAAVISSLKIVVMPLLFIVSAVSIKLGPEFSTSILEAGMPVALTNFALAEIYPMNKKIIAKAIILSTVFSLFTLSLFAFLVV